MPTRTIIIADDEPHLVRILAYNIEKSGAKVHVATNGIECFEMALKLVPDLIVSDYQMPLMDGLQSCVKLREQPVTANIPVIMLTARGHRLTAEELARTRIVALLPKPFSARQLLTKIDEILAAPQAGVAA